jgi:hypothetical protein
MLRTAEIFEAVVEHVMRLQWDVGLLHGEGGVATRFL